MEDPTVLVALLGIFSAVITAAFGMATWSQKKVAATQDQLVAVLKEQINTANEEKKLLAVDNREQAGTIVKMGVSIDRLTDQVSLSARLLEDVFYGREPAPSPSSRRRSGS